jgi:hypothetical protein
MYYTQHIVNKKISLSASRLLERPAGKVCSPLKPRLVGRDLRARRASAPREHAGPPAFAPQPTPQSGAGIKGSFTPHPGAFLPGRCRFFSDFSPTLSKKSQPLFAFLPTNFTEINLLWGISWFYAVGDGWHVLCFI